MQLIDDNYMPSLEDAGEALEEAIEVGLKFLEQVQTAAANTVQSIKKLSTHAYNAHSSQANSESAFNFSTENKGLSSGIIEPLIIEVMKKDIEYEEEPKKKSKRKGSDSSDSCDSDF